MPYTVEKLKLICHFDSCAVRVAAKKCVPMFDTKDDDPQPFLEAGWLEPAAARVELEYHIRNFMQDAVEWDRTKECGSPPTRGLKVSAGLGKTATALRCIAAHGAPILKTGHILFYVPTLVLAERAEKDFAELGSGMPSLVLRGREAENPTTGEPMCKKADLVKKISKSVPSVTKALCRKKVSATKTIHADCAHECAYLRQSNKRQNSVVFLAHSYLRLPPPLVGDTALRIIDEKFWPTLSETLSISVVDWLFSARLLEGDEVNSEYNSLRHDLLKWLDNGDPIHVGLRIRGVKKATLRQFAAFEAKQRFKIELSPQMNPKVLAGRVSQIDKKADEQAAVRVHILELLARTFSQESTERLSLFKKLGKLDEPPVLKAHILADLPSDAPILLMDADLDEALVERLCPGTKIVTLLSRPRAQITQISDFTMSTHSLVTKDGAKLRRDKLATIIQREVESAKEGKVLLVTTKAILTALYQDANCLIPLDCKPEELPQLHGSSARWFGPRMLGVNDYEDYSTVIVIGRLQTGVATVEDDLRAIFGDTGTPIELAKNSRLSEADGELTVADNASVGVKIQQHPDSRGAALLKQTREAQSEQAIARLRLISPKTRKRVVIICNIPLSGLPPTKVVKFEALAKGVTDFHISNRFVRLEEAITKAKGGALEGLRVSSDGLVKDAAHAFVNPSSGENFRVGFDTKSILETVCAVAEHHGMLATPVGLRSIHRGGNRVPAVVFADRKRAIETATKLWPGYACEVTDRTGEISKPARDDDQVFETD